MTIEYYCQGNYGQDYFYIIDTNIAQAVSRLTGRKTLTQSDFNALRSLGFELKEVIKPR